MNLLELKSGSNRVGVLLQGMDGATQKEKKYGKAFQSRESGSERDRGRLGTWRVCKWLIQLYAA